MAVHPETSFTYDQQSLQSRSPSTRYHQSPIAIVGLACRLPGDSNTPAAFWRFLERCGTASIEPPESRFNIKGHEDGSKKPGTMASPGGMFLENIDPKDIDAQFFRLSKMEATAMDPQQRQLLEVVYEGLENAGITLEELNDQPIGCFVGSYAADYGDMQARDPEERAPATSIGVGRAMLSNRISHFLNIKGPSMTIDTACSGSLIGVDVACRYLQSGEVDGAIIAGANIYLSPEHVMDHLGTSGTASASGLCHTFDGKADGYIKAEAVNMVFLKRLDDAIRDGNPIRAVIRGSATSSDGWTAGIASPSSEGQARAIRRAYANAHIKDLTLTSYVECHGTGTKAGDVIEVTGLASVFAESRTGAPLHIGSVKSNIGHSEPAAGVSGLLKVVLALEKGVIPGNPTFETPNPKIDFDRLRVAPSRATVKWPKVPFRRAGVNSFGYGGSNAHVIVDCAESVTTHVSSYISENDDPFADEPVPERPYLVVLSANDEQSLRGYCKALNTHLSNPAVRINLRDLAFTLSERRTRHFHRAFMVANSNELSEHSFTLSKVRQDPPRIGFVFTGQGAQWPEMGRDLVATFPTARRKIEALDQVLETLPDPPQWTLLGELTEKRPADHLRDPMFSQPLVTALQLAMLAVLNECGVQCETVVGHSSGEIAAAVAAGLITETQAIKIAYLRGKAASQNVIPETLGMLAVGLGQEKVEKYVNKVLGVEIGCVNSPDSVTLSGDLDGLKTLQKAIAEDGHFARLLQVNTAYHSSFMACAATHYRYLLQKFCDWTPPRRNSIRTEAKMFSSVTGKLVSEPTGWAYWEQNMVSPVLFKHAVEEMITKSENLDLLIEIGPSNALAGPINQIKKPIQSSLEYISALKRGPQAVPTMLEVIGKLFTMGSHVAIAPINKDKEAIAPATIVDLPNYVWNHSVKYWHESDASKDWRLRKFVKHDLLGSKMFGVPWSRPMFKNNLRVQSVTWLKDHKLNDSVVFPAAGYVAMAMEALYQTSKATGEIAQETLAHQLSYRLRNVAFLKAMMLEDDTAETKLILSLNPAQGTPGWYEFQVSTKADEIVTDHCKGLICLAENSIEVAKDHDLRPLEFSSPAPGWYKVMRDVGYNFGKAFQTQLEIEAIAGSRSNRGLVSLSEPESSFAQSAYPMHPAPLDGCFQTAAASLWQGHRSRVNAVLLPAMIDELVIKARSSALDKGLALARSEYLGVGREDDPKCYKSHASVYDPKTGHLLFQMTGLQYHKLDSNRDLHSDHSYTYLTWKPDISALSRTQLDKLLQGETSTQTTLDDSESFAAKLKEIVGLVSHRTPKLKVLEADMTEKLASAWLHSWNLGGLPKEQCRQYEFGVRTQDDVLQAQTKFSDADDVSVSAIDLMDASLRAANEGTYDLVVVKTVPQSPLLMNTMLSNATRLLSRTGSILLLNYRRDRPDSSIKVDIQTSMSALHGAGLANTSHLSCFETEGGELATAYIGFAPAPGRRPSVSERKVDIVHLGPPQQTSTVVKRGLERFGWLTRESLLATGKFQSRSTVIIVEDSVQPAFTEISSEHWEGLKRLIQAECKILWVTSRAQMDVAKPELSLVSGFARTLRAEEPGLVMMTLDVETLHSSGSTAAIHWVLERVQKAITSTNIENEFVERKGMLHISRVLPDAGLNMAEKASNHGAESVVQSFHGHKACVRLMSDRVGTLNSLHFAEVAAAEVPVRDGYIEVEVQAASLSFKDVAISLGLVPGDEHSLGLEAAGVVRRIGVDAKGFSVGQRVMVTCKASFGNRVQCRASAAHAIPDWLSFKDASTMGVVYISAIYAIVDLASTRRGQSVLIHSAAGGLGIAAIHLCKWLGAEIYCTVGNDEKRKFLRETFGIPEDHIFSSRSTAFAPQLMAATGGRGVDVILNSLTGELLDASWRCIADNGNFIEVGKKDLLDRNSLSMEPFARNASYRAFDMSLDCIPPATITRLLSRTFQLLDQGHIKPIIIDRVFPIADVAEAFRYMRAGTHIGKIVLDASDADMQLPIRPARRIVQLRPDASYMIVGGLKGLCGSLAVYLAQHGAQDLTIVSRSGYDDEKSRSVLLQLEALGTNVNMVRGDVTNLEDVRRAFAASGKPIAGVIQGAMVLRDKMFNAMTSTEFREALAPKLKGTWNLHNVSLERNEPVDFFTMLSSICGLVGQKGQANYNSANAFLDSFAAFRQQRGLPACSVDLGVIEDVGYVSERDSLAARLNSQGWTIINEGLLHKILKYSILQQSATPLNPASSTHMVTGIPVPLPSQNPLHTDIRFSGLRDTGHDSASGGNAGNNAGTKALLAAIKNQPIEKDMKAPYSAGMLTMATELVNRQLMKSLGMSEPIEAARPLTSYGIDSLVAVEFRNWAKLELNVEVTTLDVLGAKTLTSMCEGILIKMCRARFSL